jgi:endonuclease YncB( thermonuclease family)
MAYGKVVEIEPMDTDRYGRTVGLVTINGKSINEELVKNGFAWVFTRYCDKPFCNQWYKDQDEARQKKLGLWLRPSIFS